MTNDYPDQRRHEARYPPLTFGLMWISHEAERLSVSGESVRLLPSEYRRSTTDTANVSCGSIVLLRSPGKLSFTVA